MDIIDQLYNSHVSAATLDALDKYRMVIMLLKNNSQKIRRPLWIRSWMRTLIFWQPSWSRISETASVLE